MSLSVTFALRDARRSARPLLSACLAVALGVGATVAVSGIGESLDGAVRNQSRNLAGADASISSRSRVPKEALKTLTPPGTLTAQETNMSATVTLPSNPEFSEFVSIRAAETGFPFYGDLVTEPAEAGKDTADDDKVLVDESLAAKAGLKPGDLIRLGAKDFRVAGTLKSMPGDPLSFTSIFPRITLSPAALAKAGLPDSGPLIRHRLHLKFPRGTDVDALLKTAEPELKRLRLRCETAENRGGRLAETLAKVTGFLKLSAFATLLLGCVGVAAVTRARILEKLGTLSTLRCLGASAGTCFRAHLLQSASVGVAGSLAGVAVGLGAGYASLFALRGLLPGETAFTVSASTPLAGFAVGTLTCILFSLPPLLAISRIPPLAAIRADYEPKPPPLRLPEIAAHLLCALAVAGLIHLQTGDLGGTIRVFLGLAGIAGGLVLTAGALTACIRRLRLRALPFAWRQGVANLHRPGNRTATLILTLGLGSTLLLTLGLSKASVLGHLGDRGGMSRPDLLLFDIQQDQLQEVRKALKSCGGRELGMSPVVTLRLFSVKGRPVAGMAESENWSAFTHEYRSTYRSSLKATETVVAGKFEGRAPGGPGPVPVSLETGVAEKLGVTIGDELVFDVQGVPVQTRVTSLRAVDWRRFSTNFFVVFPEGALEEAPQTQALEVGTDSAVAIAQIRDALRGRMSNVSSIDLKTLLSGVEAIFERISTPVRFVAGLTLGAGVVVLACSLLANGNGRIRESVLLRTLGASASQVRSVLLAEYATLGALAAILAVAPALLLNAGLAKFVFRTPTAIDFTLVAEIACGTLALSLAAGMAAARFATRRPPLEILRTK